jgi:hypothetical protein
LAGTAARGQGEKVDAERSQQQVSERLKSFEYEARRSERGNPGNALCKGAEYLRRGAPKSKSEWIAEIAEASRDAEEAIPFGPVTGQTIEEKDLFHFAPSVCLKFRGIERTKRNLKKATDAALSSYVASKDSVGQILDDPHISFAFCYLASHFALDLVDEKQINEIMEHIEAHQRELAEAISKNG